jgi:hypothetical protein
MYADILPAGWTEQQKTTNHMKLPENTACRFGKGEKWK